MDSDEGNYRIEFKKNLMRYMIQDASRPRERPSEDSEGPCGEALCRTRFLEPMDMVMQDVSRPRGRPS